MKSDLEKNAILNAYKIFLKTCNFNIQIVIQSTKQDLSPHIKKIQNLIQKNSNNNLKELGTDYINFIKKINYSKKNSSKLFYLIISNNIKKIENCENSEEILKNDLKEKYFKIKECLSRCGNIVIDVSNSKESIDILDSFFNTRKYLKK